MTRKLLKILVVDDSVEDAVRLERHLRRGGCELSWERVDTREAMQAALENGPWDVILSDHEMPRFSAPLALTTLKEKGLNTPLIVVSGVLAEDEAIEIMRDGARDFIPKGNLARLGVVVDQAIADAGARTAGALAEQGLKATEEKYRLLLDSTAEGIFGLDSSGAVTFMNTAGAGMLGWKPDQWNGKHLGDLYRPAHPDGTPYSWEECPIFAVVQHGRKVQRDNESFYRADGRSLPVEYWAHPVRRSDQYLGAVVTFRDITKRLRALDALKYSEQKFRQLAENIDEVFSIVSAPDGELVYVSPAYEQVWGRSCESVYYDPKSWMDSIHPSDRDRVNEKFVRLLRGARLDYEYRIQRPGGSQRWIRARSFPVCNESGEVVRVAGIAQDITEQKRTEAALLQAKKVAEAGYRAKSQFLNNIGHEFRTPMNGILGMTELALAGDLTKDQRDCLETAMSSAKTLLELINGVLDLSSIEMGAITFASTEFSVRACIEDAVRQLDAPGREKGLDLIWKVEPEVPDVVIGDSARLGQTLSNLLRNAVKFTDRGTVALEVGLDSPVESLISLHFIVSDTGIGIPMENQAGIFERFSQADGSLTRKFQGAGLGLTICSELVKKMRGRIWVESKEGEGSQFHFTATFGRNP